MFVDFYAARYVLRILKKTTGYPRISKNIKILATSLLKLFASYFATVLHNLNALKNIVSSQGFL